VEFRILGPVEVEDNGLKLDLGGLRERALLARLLLSANLVVSADRLADDLWSGSPPPHSMATLRVYISRLRRALGAHAGLLVTQAPGYRLNVPGAELDAVRFERLVQAAEADLGAGRPRDAAVTLRAALGLWRGPALSDVADLAFAQADAGRLEEARLTALENRVGADLACGRHASLVAELDGLAAAHPLRERLTGQRILALYRCGRQAEALTAYAALRGRLAEELGIDPTPGLQRLHERILRQDPRLDWRPAGPAGAGTQPGVGDAAGTGDAASGGDGTSPGTGAATAGGTAAGAAAAGVASEAAIPGTAGAGLAVASPASDAATAPVPGHSGGDTDPATARPPAATPPPGLPTETTSFIGREAELDTIEELLRLSRLLTLTGPGGSGKSRLALRAGTQASGRYGGAVWLVQLAPIGQPDLVVPTVAVALSAREEPGQTLLDSVVARLRDAEALLIVDNCEHVIEAAADTIAALLRSCPRLRILATSQTRLDVPGEASWPVPPLTVPEPDLADPRAAAEAESVRLFCDRAALARPGFTLTGANVAAVGEICRQLDGIPLAIELAAARVSALTVAQLAARLGNRFRLLTGGSRAGLPRHRTLEAAIEWSHDLLSETEQVCFRRMAVFAGGCTIDAVEAVCPDESLPLDVVFETVTALIDRSLLTTEERSGSMRYGMLESIHQYALGRLAAAGEATALRRRHMAWLLGFAGQADLAGPDQAAWLDLLEAERDNFRVALEWSLTPAGPDSAAGPGRAPAGPTVGAATVDPRSAAGAGSAADPATVDPLSAAGAGSAADLATVDPRYAAGPGSAADPARALALTGALAPFWLVRGPIALARTALDAALAAAGPDADTRLRAVALDGAGQLASVQADTDAQRRYQQESLAIWRERGDDARIASTLSDLGAAAHFRGEYPLAQALHAEALEIADRTGDAQQTGQALSGLGRLALHQGDLGQATAYYTQSMARFTEIGDLRRATLILGNLGVVAINSGDLALAEQRLTEHLDNARRLGDHKLTSGALTNLGLVAYQAGDLDRAAGLHQQALELSEQLGDRRLVVVALGNLGLVAARRRNYAAAAQFHLRSLEVAESVGERRSVAEMLEELAAVEAAAGNAGRAATLFGASQAIRQDIGAPIVGSDQARLNEARDAAAAALGGEAFAAAHQAGLGMSAEEAVALAKDGSWPPMTQAKDRPAPPVTPARPARHA
jgi:predicted ATPase/DNA-binding SARP family transcriptional activator